MRAPFPARVANPNLSVGQFARQGEPIFALVDTRRWYVVANFREAFLESIRPGQDVEVYLMPYPHRRFHGTVQGVGWAIQTPDTAPNGTLMGVKPTPSTGSGLHNAFPSAFSSKRRIRTNLIAWA